MDTDLGTMLRGLRSGFKVRTVRPAAGKSERSLNLDHEATEHSFSAPAPKAKMPYNLENLNLVIKLVILKRCIYSGGVVIIYCRAACLTWHESWTTVKGTANIFRVLMHGA